MFIMLLQLRYHFYNVVIDYRLGILFSYSVEIVTLFKIRVYDN